MTRFLLAALVFLAALLAGRALAPPEFLRDTDYMEYAGAARLFAERHNPYDWTALLALQRAHGSEWSHAGMMWNPPWALPLVAPLAALPWRAGQAVWTWAGALAVAASALWLWRGPRGRGFALLLAFAFAPAVDILKLGQITGFTLLGLAGFVRWRESRPAVAGLCLALTATKPHLLLPFALVLALDATRSAATRRAVAWGVGVLLAAALLAEAVVPGVWGHWRAATAAPGNAELIALSEWQPPTLAAAWRRAAGGDLWVQFVPSVVASATLPVWWWRRRDRWDWAAELPLVSLVCLLTTGYGAWSHDVALTLPAVLDAAARIGRRAGERARFWLFGGYLAFNALAATGAIPVVWWSPLVAAGWAASFAWPRETGAPPGG